ncbi:MAG: hypothetical protein ACFCGT_03305 [Sandaracinaceae bacterium]
MFEVIGWSGVVLYTVAYAAVSKGWLSGRSKRYQGLNLVAATGVASNALYHGAVPPTVVNVVWFLIALFTLTSLWRARPDADPARPASPAGRRVHPAALLGVVMLAVLAMATTLLNLWSTRAPPRPIPVYTGQWEPYVGPGLPDDGPVAELAREILLEAGYRADVRFAPWELAEDNVAERLGAAAFPFVGSRERRRRFLLTEPFVHLRFALFFRRPPVEGSWPAISRAMLGRWLAQQPVGRTFRLGYVRGYDLWPSLRRAVEADGTDLVEYGSLAEAFVALDQGEIDLLPESTVVGMAALRGADVPVDAEHVSTFEERIGLSFLVAPNALGRRLVAELDDAIRSPDPRERELRAMLDGITPSTGTEPVPVEIDALTPAETERGEAVTLAAGTRGTVLRWPPAFLPAEDDGGPAPGPEQPTAGEPCEVKLTSGPLSGRVVRVAPASIRVLPSGAER